MVQASHKKEYLIQITKNLKMDSNKYFHSIVLL